MMTLNIYFKCNLFNKGQACPSGLDASQTFCLGFESLQQHKRRRNLRVHCSECTVARWPTNDFLFCPFFHYIGDLSLGTDISTIYHRFFGNFLRNIPPPIFLHKISCRPLPIHDISQHFPPWRGVMATLGNFYLLGFWFKLYYRHCLDIKI